MKKENEKLKRIQEFIKKYIESTKQRGKMHGDISEIESQWWVIDHIYFILEDILDEDKTSVSFGAFLLSKGFGAKSAARIITEKKSKEPYQELIRLRNEYEKWRKKKITILKQGLKRKSGQEKVSDC